MIFKCVKNEPHITIKAEEYARERRGTEPKHEFGGKRVPHRTEPSKPGEQDHSKQRTQSSRSCHDEPTRTFDGKSSKSGDACVRKRREATFPSQRNLFDCVSKVYRHARERHLVRDRVQPGSGGCPTLGGGTRAHVLRSFATRVSSVSDSWFLSTILKNCVMRSLPTCQPVAGVGRCTRGVPQDRCAIAECTHATFGTVATPETSGLDTW